MRKKQEEIKKYREMNQQCLNDEEIEYIEASECKFLATILFKFFGNMSCNINSYSFFLLKNFLNKNLDH